MPPPRPKRKAAHPYPHKASKKGLAFFFDSVSDFHEIYILANISKRNIGGSCSTSSCLTATNFSYNGARLWYIYGYSYCCYGLGANDAFPSWENDPVQHLSPRHTQGFLFSVVVNSISDQFLATRYLSKMLQVQVQQIITLVA